MREIKFRAKNLKGNWIYGTYAYGCFYPDSHKTHRIFPSGEEIEDETLGRYTGLKDKNGKEIYESDIAVGEHATYTIRWDEKKAQYRVKIEKTNSVLIKNNSFPLWQYVEEDEDCRFEVIGNIYENPDLLK